MNITVQPWSTVGPAGAALHVAEGPPPVAWVEPHHPPCIEHVGCWTGIGFPRHPSVMVYLCVRCWNVFDMMIRE